MPGLRSHDQGFVAASPDRVFGTLADPSTYPVWWPGARVNGSGVFLPMWPGNRRFALERHREGIGLYLASGDDSLEWYLEPFDDGTIVNALLEVQTRATRRLLRMRGALRGALVGLKHTLEPGS